MPNPKSRMTRFSFIDRFMKQREKEAIRQARKEGQSSEEIEKLRSTPIPNRSVLRSKLGTTNRTGFGHSRIPSGRRLAPPSLETHITLQIRQPNGVIRKYVVPRDRVEGLEPLQIFRR